MDTLLHWVFWNAILATLLGFVAAGSVLLRRPALTHALWTLVLLKLITPAFIPLPIPGYFAYRGANADDAAHSRPQSAKPASELRRTGGEGAAVTPSSEDDERTAAWRQASDFVQLGSYRASLGGADRWGRTIFQIALLGAVAWFAWTGLRIRRFYGLLSLAEPAPQELVRQVERLAARIGLRRCPEVLLWDGIASPMVWCMGRGAKLLVPRDLPARLDGEQLASILLHELAHLRRGDHWGHLLGLVVTGLYWWHPVVWWARRDLERVEEQACDAWVLWALPEAGAEYADALLRTIDFLSGTRALPCPLTSGIGRTTLFKRRLRMIVEGNIPRVVSGRGRLLVALLAVGLLPLAPSMAAARRPWTRYWRA